MLGDLKTFSVPEPHCTAGRFDWWCGAPPIVVSSIATPSAIVPNCAFKYAGVCFVVPSPEPFTPFFGFATFITALTLIAVVFTISDARYRFRIGVAPLPLIPISFWLSVTIGFSVLLSDILFAERLPMPDFLQSHVLWQGLFGGLFLGLVAIWLYFAFLNPARFGRWNAERFIALLYQIVVRGNDAELATIASELAPSVQNIVDFCPEISASDGERLPTVAACAHDLLLLMGSRKLCKAIVNNAPGTAITLFQRISETRKYRLPVRQLTINLSSEAIQNPDSILYHEDEGYESGLLGYIKPFSGALYGDYNLVEGLGNDFGSPLDVGLGASSSWNSKQLNAYCRVTLITLKSYLGRRNWGAHSYALTRAFGSIKNGVSDTYKLNDPQTPYFPSDIVERLDVVVRFVRDAIDEVAKIDQLPKPIRLRRSGDGRRARSHDIYDELAGLMYELVLAASYVRSDADRSWTIQHNTVWSNFFGFASEGEVWPIVQYKLRRRIFDAVTRMPFLDYQSARVLGMALNVLGFKAWQGQNTAERTLQKALLSWTKRNFVKRWNENPEVAVSGLPVSLVFEGDEARFVKTYAKGLQREAPKEYFTVNK